MKDAIVPHKKLNSFLIFFSFQNLNYHFFLKKLDLIGFNFLIFLKENNDLQWSRNNLILSSI